MKLQEMQDLENQFRTKRKLMVDDALSKLHEKYDKLRDSLAKQHQEELAALQVNKIHNLVLKICTEKSNKCISDTSNAKQFFAAKFQKNKLK